MYFLLIYRLRKKFSLIHWFSLLTDQQSVFLLFYSFMTTATENMIKTVTADDINNELVLTWSHNLHRFKSQRLTLAANMTSYLQARQWLSHHFHLQRMLKTKQFISYTKTNNEQPWNLHIHWQRATITASNTKNYSYRTFNWNGVINGKLGKHYVIQPNINMNAKKLLMVILIQKKSIHTNSLAVTIFWHVAGWRRL